MASLSGLIFRDLLISPANVAWVVAQRHDLAGQKAAVPAPPI
jgi:hypothetical protein